MKQNRNKSTAKNIVLLMASVTVTFLVCEWAVRHYLHIKPGYHTNSQWFTEVDTLKELKGFYADSDGIFKITPGAAEYAHNCIDSPETHSPAPEGVSWQAYGLEGDFILLNNPSFHHPLADYIHGIKLKDSSLPDEFEQAVIYYSTHPVNEDGFRSIAFKNYHTKRKKILLLGDSFAWGHSAKPLTNSFADLLLAKGYVVYNTGISGADPAQYLAIAKKYIPLLKPDYVVVNFFMGNDIEHSKRWVLPYHPIFYDTNAGNLISCPDGIYFENALEAYKYCKAHLEIPHSGFWNVLCRKAAVFTLAWKTIDKLNYVARHGIKDYNLYYRYKDRVDYGPYWQEADSLFKETPVCNDELEQIKELCALNNAGFFLIAIPELRGETLYTPDKAPGLFAGLKYYN
ncbi:MAG TPA: SGNH/GDSL hydrolase family protein, partial [Chitinophagales bacterium]|nr:SGNH/GDSL hydrolase family protein [Chitinophagales bacterium]